MFLNLIENTLLLSDVHYNKKRTKLLELLNKIGSKEICVSQIILMGDIFDFLCIENNFFISKNKNAIDLLNKISKDIPIIYLEGNHDYNLSDIFHNIIVFPREQQPIQAIINDKDSKNDQKIVSLNHGDLFISFIYSIYCKIIRNSIFLKILGILDINDIFSKRVHNKLIYKYICSDISYFEILAKNRTKYFKEDIIIEGHYHQGKSYKFKNKEYINIPSFECSSEYSIINNGEFKNIKFL